jgi:transposase
MHTQQVGHLVLFRPEGSRPKTPSQLKAKDLSRAVRKLGGMEAVIELRDSWSKMESGYGGREWEHTEGVIIGLINQGLSQKEIRAVLPVGGFCCARLKKAVNTNFVDFHTKHGPAVGSNVVTTEELQFLEDDVAGWETEDGFPCAHRRPWKYLMEENISWTKLYDHYAEKAKAAVVESSQRVNGGSIFNFIFQV